jgi:Fe-S-cluster containining protein
MREIDTIAREIAEIGFHCQRCGRCCRAEEDTRGFVMVDPEEVMQILGATGRSWDQVAVPYPEFMECAGGRRITLSWCLRCTEGKCAFFDGKGCSVYPHRPWICRTYPFVLEDGCLRVSACAGIGQPITAGEARTIARDLIARSRAEAIEENGLQRILADLPVLEQGTYVVDSRGITRCEF